MWLYLIAAIVVAYAAYNRLLHPLAKVPGPFLASITPLWLLWQCKNLRRPKLDLELHRRYGSVVRISPDEIMFSNPDHFQAVYGAGTKFTKSRYYEVFTDHPFKSSKDNWDHLDMLTEFDIEKLRVQKRLGVPIYSVKNTKKHETLIDEVIDMWTNRLDNVLVGHVVDIYPEIELLDVDILSQITFGQPFGAVDAGTDGGQMHQMWQLWKHWCWVGNLPTLNAVCKLLAKYYHQMATNILIKGSTAARLAGGGQFPVFKFAVGKILEYDSSMTEDHAKSACLLDDFRNLSDSRKEFRQNWGTRLSMTDLGAGVDTMSWTMASVIAGVCSDPKVYGRLRAEIDTVSQAENILKGVPVSYDEAVKFEYLQACMWEAQRKWPNVAVSMPRVAPVDGINIDGYYVPQGYVVGMNSKQLGLSESVFGADPDLFKPERWLQASKHERNEMETKNLAFGGPSRKCPGMHMAWTCMTKILATLFFNYDVKLLNNLDGPPGPGGKQWIEEGAFPTKWIGMEVDFKKR